ncbi:unnamed protein product [Ceratitis capitata]|uniref:(Mediterranean fruit fly) hypothetical protein n=1 Tax=Ceratitis capitata TaxID=7213 RepID=A0A811UQ81_CERCA|nr:unnamed protein product [Ceratitis capitata]
MKNEKDILKAQLWTATAKCHEVRDVQALNSIKCFIECNAALGEEVQQIKLYITNLEHKLKVINKEICHLRIEQGGKIGQDLEKVKKLLHLLEDQYENQLQYECRLTAQSEKLRRKICELINDRRHYNSFYTRYIQQLTSENKYMTDLIDFVLDQIEMGIDMFEKLEMQHQSNKMALEKRKYEMVAIQRFNMQYERRHKFQEQKLVKRSLTKIPAKELMRREICRSKYIKKLHLYNNVLKKIMDYCKVTSISQLIRKFQEQENLYYSFNNHSNELSYRITLLNNSVARLFGEIQDLKIFNRSTLRKQNDKIESLEKVLKEKRKNNQNLRNMSNSQDESIGKLFEAIQLIRDQTRTDLSMLAHEFDDHREINIKTMREQMKLLENRIYSIVCVMYKIESKKRKAGDPSGYLIKDIGKLIERPTLLSDIVLATQCAECAEGDSKNLEDQWTVNIMPPKQLKTWVSEKVVQPEVQYRLHSINQCRLTRSRSRRQHEQESS